jgi:hypothetical protein
MRTVLLATAAALLGPAAASAATFDFAADFGSSVFSYGFGQGTTFTPFTGSFSGGCFGVATLACRTPGGNSNLPYIGATTDGSGFSVQTIDVPANTLLFHPGSAVANSDAILIFTAPTSTLYTIAGEFLRLDRVDGGGNGVLLQAYVNGGFADSTTLPNAPQYVSTFLNGSVFLNAGDTLQINVGNNGEYTYDTTGLRGSISSAGVPEPATWALMILGFGAVGGAMRRRQGVKANVRFA